MTLFDTVNLFFAFIDQGGLVMWPIFFVSLVIWYTGFGRLHRIWYLGRERKRFLGLVSEFSEKETITNFTHETTFNNFLKLLVDIKSEEKKLSYFYGELQMVLTLELDRGFSTMIAWISAAPLLGLLGTVVGMVETFEVINSFGIGNPHLMAQGISKALLTTQAGLTVAFPALIFHLFLYNKKNQLVQTIIRDQKKIAGYLNLRPLPEDL